MACSPSRILGVLCVAVPALASVPGLPTLVGVQGLDDQVMSDVALSISSAVLQERYAAELADIHPGLRRYNFFWSALEGAVPPTGQPQDCPPSTFAVPINETDRIARTYATLASNEYGRVTRDRSHRTYVTFSLCAGGYNLFHCYDSGMAAQQDTFLAADAAIGAASALIVYGSPSWAADPACTGFPWGPGPNYRQGCIPWAQLEAWEDFILFTAERWHAPWGSGQPRISGHVIWNEIQSQVGCEASRAVMWL